MRTILSWLKGIWNGTRCPFCNRFRVIPIQNYFPWDTVSAYACDDCLPYAKEVAPPCPVCSLTWDGGKWLGGLSLNPVMEFEDRIQAACYTHYVNDDTPNARQLLGWAWQIASQRWGDNCEPQYFGTGHFGIIIRKKKTLSGQESGNA